MCVRIRVVGQRDVLKGHAAVVVLHSLKRGHRGKRRTALAHYRFRDAQRKAPGGAADVRTEAEAVIAALQQPAVRVPGHAAVIERSHALQRDLYGELFALAGLYSPGLVEAAEHSRRLAELTLGGFAVDLHHLPAGNTASVLNGDVSGDDTVLRRELRRHIKCRVGKSEAEGIAHPVPCKRFKIAVADINVLAVAVLLAAAKVLVRGVVADFKRNGVRELSAGGSHSGEHRRRPCAADHSALPHVHNGGDIIAVHEAHVDKSGGVQQHHRPAERPADPFQHVLFHVGEQESALFELVVHLLAGGPADDDYRRVAALRCGIHDVVSKWHFLLGPGLAAPALAVVERVLAVPDSVDAEQGLVNVIAGFDEPIGYARDL